MGTCGHPSLSQLGTKKLAVALMVCGAAEAPPRVGGPRPAGGGSACGVGFKVAASASQATAAHEECLEAVVRGCLLRGRGGALRRADDLRRASCDFAAFLQQRLAPFYATLAESTPSGIGPPTPPPPPPPRPQTDSPSAEAHGGHALPPKNAERACFQCAVRFLYERPAGAPRRIEGVLSASCTQQAINRERLEAAKSQTFFLFGHYHPVE